MKIEDARVRYNIQIKTYYSKQKELYAQKQKLEEKIKTTENGAEVYKMSRRFLSCNTVRLMRRDRNIRITWTN